MRTRQSAALRTRTVSSASTPYHAASAAIARTTTSDTRHARTSPAGPAAHAPRLGTRASTSAGTYIPHSHAASAVTPKISTCITRG